MDGVINPQMGGAVLPAVLCHHVTTRTMKLKFAGLLLAGLIAVGTPPTYMAWRYRTIAIQSQTLTDTIVAELTATRNRADITAADLLTARRLAQSTAHELSATKELMESTSATLSTAQKQAESNYAELAANMVRGDANLPLKGTLNARKAALAVRDYIYREYDGGPEDLPGASPATLWTALSSDSSDGMMCGGAGLAYSWALHAIGIPSRFVQLAGENYLSGKDMYQTHVTVEAWLDGAWEISDPTYNVSVACSDHPSKHIATPQARECIQRGKSLVLIPGKTRFSKRSKYAGKTISPKRYASYFAAYRRRSTSTPYGSVDEDSAPQADWLEIALKAYPQ
ncbi:MAG: hypothetical protein BGP05_17235 [Rhizobiales bacterium 62-47]|nr:MAG: hypothetical protein BGP05_17235 [Rhizobiales bacterium 62-47]